MMEHDREDSAMENRNERASVDIQAAAADPSRPEIPGMPKDFTWLPYAYSADESENVILNTGALEYTVTDFTVPGRGGLDLVIRRRYNSQQSNNAYFLFGEKNRTTQDKDETRDNDHLWQAYGLGYGWSFVLPSIEEAYYYDSSGEKKDRKYLHMGDGRIFAMRDTIVDGSDNLQQYKRKDLYLRKNSDKNKELPLPHGGSVGYEYVLEHKDGRRDYLGERTIVATQDRFGNTIRYEFKENGGATIVDSLNKRYQLQRLSSIMTWSGLPGGKTVSYEISQQRLLRDTNQEGQVRQYTYSTETVRHPKDEFEETIKYQNLKEITHPTGAKTVYNYRKNFIDTINTIPFWIESRHDTEGGVTRNKQTFVFTYTSNIVTKAVVRQMEAVGTGTEEKEYTKTEHFFSSSLRTGERIYHGDIKVSDREFSYHDKYDLLLREDMFLPYEQITEWAYDDRANLLTMSDPLRNRVEIAYDAKYSLPIQKSYNKNHQGTSNEIVEEYTLTENKAAVFQMRVYANKSGRKTLQLTEYEYDGFGNVAKEHRFYEINSDWRHRCTTQFTYTNGAFLSEKKAVDVKDADDKTRDIVESWEHDDHGRVKSHTDPNGNKTTYTYDGLGRITLETYPDGASRKTEYRADTAANQITVTDIDGKTEKRKNRTVYTPLGRPSEVWNDMTKTLLESYSYDEHARLTEETRHGPAKAVRSKTLYEYDRFGRVESKKITDSGGTVLSRETTKYNNANRTETVTVHGDEPDEDMVTVTVHGDEPDENIVTETEYDKLGRVVRRTVGGARTTYTYDCMGNRLTETDPLGRVTGWEYDHGGRVTRETDPAGKHTVSSYDGLGNLVASTDQMGNTTTCTYDALGRVLKRSTPFQKSGSSVHNAVCKYDYDAAGNVTRERSSRGLPGSGEEWRTTEHTYDSRGRLTRTTAHGDNGEKVYSSYKYDLFGNKTHVYQGLESDPVVTKYEYDTFGSVTKITDPLGQAESYTYDATGLQLSKTDRGGNVTAYTYDSLGRLLTETVTDAAGKPNGFRGMSYTKTGEKKTEWNDALTIAYFYNSRGLLWKQTEGAVVKEYTYDAADNRTTFTLSADGGKTLQLNMRYDYDELHRLLRVWQHGEQIAAYTYDANGNRTLLSGPNGADTVYAYNAAGMVTGLTHRRNKAVQKACSYTYRLDGNQVSKTEGGVTTAYTYDALGRLTEEKAPGSVTAYTYNRYGNRTKMTVTGAGACTVDYDYDRNNRIRRETRTRGLATETTGYHYDRNGNLYSREKSLLEPRGTAPGRVGFGPVEGLACIRLLRYNGFNQLVFAYLDGVEARYDYRPDGLRHGKTVAGARTTHHWDGDEMAAEQSGGAVSRYLRGAELIAVERGGARRYCRHNAHGDVMLLTDGAAANVVREYGYDAFGVERTPDAADPNPFRYCGEYLDAESGWIYLRARYYDPSIGRFLAEDSAGDGLNWYVYCDNNPVRFVDPSGNFALTAIIGGALLGAAIGWGTNLIGQLYSNGWNLGNINQRSLWAAFGTGAITGALAPLTAGVSLAGSAALGAVAGGATLGGLHYGVNNLLGGNKSTLTGYAGAAIAGGVTAGVMHGVNELLNKPSIPYLDTPQDSGILNIGAGKNPIEGAYNIDIDPQHTSVRVGDATNLSNIATGSQSKVVIQNPYRYSALNPEVYRVLQPGGKVEMIGTWSNPFFKNYYTLGPTQLKSLGYSALSKGPMVNPGVYNQTSGQVIRGTILELILQKSKGRFI